jgi:hypothetical protein
VFIFTHTQHIVLIYVTFALKLECSPSELVEGKYNPFLDELLFVVLMTCQFVRYTVNDDFMKAVRKMMETKKLEGTASYKKVV